MIGFEKKVMLWMSWEALKMKPNFEPTSDARVLARSLFDMFMAMVKEGFSEDQALSIISTVIYTMNRGG